MLNDWKIFMRWLTFDFFSIQNIAILIDNCLFASTISCIRQLASKLDFSFIGMHAVLEWGWWDHHIHLKEQNKEVSYNHLLVSAYWLFIWHYWVVVIYKVEVTSLSYRILTQGLLFFIKKIFQSVSDNITCG